MSFTVVKMPPRPPRLWTLCAYAGDGKSTFFTAMKGPLLAVDADHRIAEVVELAEAAGKKLFQVSDIAADMVTPDAIARCLYASMATAGPIGTIGVDSLTTIIAPFVVQAMVDKATGTAANLSAAFVAKALAMRQLQDNVTRWGTDVLWIYHLYDARDQHSREVVKESVSKTELARLTRSINMRLSIVRDGERRGIHIDWCRRGRSGATLWDATGTWAGMPEAIEAAAWAVQRGAFKEADAALRAYHGVKSRGHPADALEMAALWVGHVTDRLQEGASGAADTNPDASEMPTALSPDVPAEDLVQLPGVPVEAETHV